MKIETLKDYLENLYFLYNKKKYVYPDPLQFLYDYQNFSDIEIVGLICSSFAYGRVNNIISFLEKILKIIESPYDFIVNIDEKNIKKIFKKFKYRFTTSEEIVDFFLIIKKVINNHYSLYKLFLKVYNKHKNIEKAVRDFIEKCYCYSNGSLKTLLPNYKKNSAFKRFFLFLRWMVRNDEVDLGIWEKIPKQELIIPLDIHMYKIAKMINFTSRRTADLKTAIEITQNFKNINPDDPVKYDFVLTRFGIHPEIKKLVLKIV